MLLGGELARIAALVHHQGQGLALAFGQCCCIYPYHGCLVLCLKDLMLALVRVHALADDAGCGRTDPGPVWACITGPWAGSWPQCDALLTCTASSESFTGHQ